MNYAKINKAFNNALTGTIYPYFPLSELSKPITPNFVLEQNGTFRTMWWDDDTGHQTYSAEKAENTKNEIVKIFTQELKDRNIIVEITGKVVQEFHWPNADSQYYDLDNHGITYAVIMEGKILDTIGSIYKNGEDIENEYLDHKIGELRANIDNLLKTTIDK